MPKSKNLEKLARAQMLKILRNGRVTEQTTGKGDDAKTVTTKRPPSTSDLRLALDMAVRADAVRDYDDAEDLRKEVRAVGERRGLRLGAMPPMHGDDAATKAS